MTGDKFCGGCSKRKSVDEFCMSSVHADGLQTQCKRCMKRHRRQWRRANPDKARAEERRRPPRSKKDSPEQQRARNLLGRAVRRGDVVRPEICEDCGERRKIHGHHDDYSRPLDVRWLCARCHGALHAALRAAA